MGARGSPTPLIRARAPGADDSTPESVRRPPDPQRLSPHLVIFRYPGASPTALRRQLGKQTQRQIVPRLIPGKDAKSHPATPNTPSPPPPPGPPFRRGPSAVGLGKHRSLFLPSTDGRGIGAPETPLSAPTSRDRDRGRRGNVGAERAWEPVKGRGWNHQGAPERQGVSGPRAC